MIPDATRIAAAPPSTPAGHASAVGKERFAAYIAHELRTPLATQRVLLELALTDPHADVASWREIGVDVLRACMQQERLLETCLTLARSCDGLTRYEPVDLAAIAYEALRTHNPSGLESLVALQPAEIRGDPDLVERLVANLVSNAIRHNVAGGRIEIATHTGSDAPTSQSPTPASSSQRRSCGVSSNRSSDSTQTPDPLATVSGWGLPSCKRSPTRTMRPSPHVPQPKAASEIDVAFPAVD